MSNESDVISSYIGPDESVQAVFTAYSNGGFGRRVVGVTDRRLILVKSRYWSISDKGLIWADPLEQVALQDTYSIWLTNGFNTGNAYIRIRRANGGIVTLNPRSSFIGNTPSAQENIETLYELISGRY